MNTIAAYAGVARAPFLLLPPTLIAAGAAASHYHGAFSWPRTLVALVGLTVLHMAVNALNEWSDMRTGIDLNTERTPFSGGSGTLPGGALSPRATLIFGCCCSAVGLLAGLWFLYELGPVMVPILVFGALSVLAYTDVLARLGVGELAAGLGLGGVPVIGTALVQNGEVVLAAWAASVPAFLMTFNLLLLNEFPDEVADRTGGRRNLVLLFGRRVAAWIYLGAAIAVPVWIVAAVVLGFFPRLALVALLPSLLVVGPGRWAIADPMLSVPHSALGANVFWNLGTNTLLAVALVVA